jgi:ABC-type oligopeptide transport system ATPase subunit
MATPDALYRLDAIQHRYGDRLVLEIPRLEIFLGETLAIIGPSGAGKSTLLRLLQFLESPTSGRIAFAGRPVDGELPLDERRRITTVFQRPAVLNRSVRDNLTYGLCVRGIEEAPNRVEELAPRRASRRGREYHAILRGAGGHPHAGLSHGRDDLLKHSRVRQEIRLEHVGFGYSEGRLTLLNRRLSTVWGSCLAARHVCECGPCSGQPCAGSRAECCPGSRRRSERDSTHPASSLQHSPVHEGRPSRPGAFEAVLP